MRRRTRRRRRRRIPSISTAKSVLGRKTPRIQSSSLIQRLWLGKRFLGWVLGLLDAKAILQRQSCRNDLAGWACRVMKPQDCRISRLQDCKRARLQECKIAGPVESRAGSAPAGSAPVAASTTIAASVTAAGSVTPAHLRRKKRTEVELAGSEK